MGTGAVSTVKTSNEGAFTIPGLPFGTYSVKVIAVGFRQWEATNVQVITAQDSNLRAMLEIGGANEVVTVTEVQSPVDSTSSELKTHVDRKQIVDLPSTTRNPLDFATQMAGVTSTGAATAGSSVMNGLRGSSNNLVQDGIDVRDSFIKTSGFAAAGNITLESIGEFSITGQNVGSDSGDGVVQIRMSTTRGGNQFHGSAFYAGRNDCLQRKHLDQQLHGHFASHPQPAPLRRFHRRTRRYPETVPGQGANLLLLLVFRIPAPLPEHRRADGPHRGRAQRPVHLSGRGRREPYRESAHHEYAEPANQLVHQITDRRHSAARRRRGGYRKSELAGDGLNIVGIRFNSPGTEMDKLYDLRIDHKLAESNKWGTHWLEAVWHWEHDSTSPSTDAQFPQGYRHQLHRVRSATSRPPRSSVSGLGALAMNSTFGASAFNEIRVGFSRPDFTFLPPKPLRPRVQRILSRGRQPIAKSKRERDFQSRICLRSPGQAVAVLFPRR